MFEDTASSMTGVMLAVIWDDGFQFIQNAWITVVGLPPIFLFPSLAPHFGACSHFWSIGLISQFLDHFTDSRTPWTGDQFVASLQYSPTENSLMATNLMSMAATVFFSKLDDL
jgi:hypothetical protein